MATLDELAAFVASACSLTVGTDLFKGFMPDKPDACAAIYEYGGSAPDRVFGQAAISVEYPRVQVVFRGAPKDYATPRSTAETAYKAFASAGAQTVTASGFTSARYLTMLPLQPPFPVRPPDTNNRYYLGFNVETPKGLSA